MPCTLIIFGLVMVAAGLLTCHRQLGLGRLPGDIVIDRPDFSLSLPVMTSLIVSLALSVILSLVNR